MWLTPPLFMMGLSISSQHYHTEAKSTKNVISSYSTNARTKLLQLRNLKRDDEDTESPLDKQNDEYSMCSCSPVKLDFVIDFTQDCETNTLSENSGILSSFCFVDIVSNSDSNSPSPTHVELVDQVAFINATVRGEIIPGRHLQKESFSDDLMQNEVNRKAPIEITSVQYLEFDTSGDLTVLNQDDTHALNASFTDGDFMSYFSITSFLDPTIALGEQMEFVPGGASLIINGKNADGVAVRNRVFWIYNLECGKDVVTINDGDSIGWVTISANVNAWPAFCPASAPNAPTISPRSPEPSYERSLAPTISVYTAEHNPSVLTIKPGQSTSMSSTSKSSKATTDDLSVMYQVSAAKSSKSFKASDFNEKKSSKSSKSTTFDPYFSNMSKINHMSNSMSYDIAVHSTPTEAHSTKLSNYGGDDDGETLRLDLFCLSYNAELPKVSSHFSKSSKSVSSKSNKFTVADEIVIDLSSMPYSMEFLNKPRHSSKSSKSVLSSSKSSKSYANYASAESTHVKGTTSKSSKCSESAMKSSKAVPKTHESGSTTTSYYSVTESNTDLVSFMPASESPETELTTMDVLESSKPLQSDMSDSNGKSSDEADQSNEDSVSNADDVSESEVSSSGTEASKYDESETAEIESGKSPEPNSVPNNSMNSFNMSFDKFDNYESYLPISEEVPSEAKEMAISAATSMSQSTILLTVLFWLRLSC
ncbi:hypothetical protein ACHAXS_013548 [Conticribra weissflogii]